MNSKIVIIIVGVAIIIVLLVFSLVDYRNEIWNARKRISVAKKIEWSEGTIEYETGGQGLPILIVHGGGGGFDQGRLLAKNVLGDDFLWIAPSRFGYLGSDLPQNADISLQAKAYEALLDELGIEKVAVLALSAGGPSAIHFVLSKQERSTALVMLSAISLTIPEYDKTADSFKLIYKSDFLFYVISRLFKKKLKSLFGITPDVAESMTQEQSLLFDEVLDTMLPAAARMPGIEYDSLQGVAPSQWPLEEVNVPTLVVHARDDTLIPYLNAENSASRIPDVRLISYDKGGHGVFIFERESISQYISSFIRESFASYSSSQ